MKIPKKLKVGGHVYTVNSNWRSRERNDLLGRSMHDTKEIWLARSVEANRVVAQSEVEESFLHEIIHCVCNEYTANRVKEEDVRQISKGLYQVLKNNFLLS